MVRQSLPLTENDPASKTQEEHIEHLRKVFEALAHHGLVINVDKCEFGLEQIKFLGHQVDGKGIKPNPNKVHAVTHFPPPTSIKGLQESAGMINFYHRFIPQVARIMSPVYQTLASKPKELFWTPELTEAFQQAKLALAKATLLHHPEPNAQISVSVDASDKAVGGVLEQLTKGKWQPLAFFSKQLRKPETKYSTFDRELLAMYLAIRHFRYFLEGRQFTVFTDHKPLSFAFRKVSDSWSARQHRHLSAISEFTTDVRHIAGKLNTVADTMSRAQVLAIEIPDIDFKAMAKDQRTENIQAYRTAITGLKIEDVPVGMSETTLLCDTSTGSPRPIVPDGWRKKVFDAVHGLSHPSIRTTRKLLNNKFVWHGMNKQLTEWARQCVPCQQAKIHRHVNAPLQDYPTTPKRFQHVNVARR